jgi:hypothetical protein
MTTVTVKKTKKGYSPARIQAMALMKEAEARGNADEKALARGSLKALKFKEIVVPRVNRTLAQLNGISKLANRSAYAWDAEQAEKIAHALTVATAKAIDKLTRVGKAEVEKFSL